MDEKYNIHQIGLNYPSEKEKLISFLRSNNLKFEDDIDLAYGIFDSDENILGCGCASKSLLKCFAVDSLLRGENALGSLISYLTEDRFNKGYYNLKVITRAHNIPLFESCGFYTLANTNTLALLANKKNAVGLFTDNILGQLNNKKDSEKSCIVMNANPFTKGHRYLIEQAARYSELLLVFVLESDRSFFPAKDRLNLVKEGCKDLSNVYVFSGGEYLISEATFPTYFLKEEENSGELYSLLDATLFAEKIAPLLNITKRFVGSEPLDNFTNLYNKTLKEVLPENNIELIELERLCVNNETVSAFRVRKLLKEKGVCEEIKELVPEVTYNYLKENYG